MNTIHLDGLDLNLLVVLDALLELGSATRAAQRLGVSQSAVSHALRRAREALGDPLLVRGQSGLVPTPRGESLRAPVRRALAELRSAVAPTRFDPVSTTATFRIAAPDYGAVLLLPRLVARLQQQAPGADVVFLSAPNDVLGALGEDGVDLVFGAGGLDLEGLFQQRLWDDGFACVLRADHPRLDAPWDLDLYCSLGHVLIAPRGQSGGQVDTLLEALGRRRRVVARVAHFAAAAHVVAGSDTVSTLPARIAAQLAPSLGLVVRPPPLPLQGFSIVQWWHDRSHADPAHAWFRALVASTAAEL